jgi:hypothetical protein
VSSEAPEDHPDAALQPDDLSALLLRAQTGLRSQVAPLAQALDQARLLVPLQKPIADVEVGVEVEFCALPGRMALEMALELIDGKSIVGLLIDPLADSELMLQRHEVASLAQGRALPLVGYVAQIPPSPEEKTLVAETDEPAPSAIVETIERILAQRGQKLLWKLTRTFNAERDLEPHWTLSFGGQAMSDELLELSDEVAVALEGKLPPPGYIDILFDEEMSE